MARWNWLARDGRATIALLASIGGAAVLTGFSVWLVRLMARLAWADPSLRKPVVEALAASNYGLLGIIGAVLLSLGLAINRRSLRASAFGASLEADGGETLETKAATKAARIGEEVRDDLD